MMVYYSWQTPSENLARVTRERAAREDDMKRGEIFEFGEKGSMGVATGGKQNGGLAFMWIRGWPKHKGVDSNPKDPTPYTGPTYEKDGRRFVPSGEYREPLQDEWYLSGLIGEPARAVLVPFPHYPILLPVPDLPEEECKSCCIVAGKFVPVDTEGFCVKCGKEVVDLNPDHPKPDGICPTCKGGIL